MNASSTPNDPITGQLVAPEDRSEGFFEARQAPLLVPVDGGPQRFVQYWKKWEPVVFPNEEGPLAMATVAFRFPEEGPAAQRIRSMLASFWEMGLKPQRFEDVHISLSNLFAVPVAALNGGTARWVKDLTADPPSSFQISEQATAERISRIGDVLKNMPAPQVDVGGPRMLRDIVALDVGNWNPILSVLRTLRREADVITRETWAKSPNPDIPPLEGGAPVLPALAYGMDQRPFLELKRQLDLVAHSVDHASELRGEGPWLTTTLEAELEFHVIVNDFGEPVASKEGLYGEATAWDVPMRIPMPMKAPLEHSTAAVSPPSRALVL